MSKTKKIIVCILALILFASTFLSTGVGAVNKINDNNSTDLFLVQAMAIPDDWGFDVDKCV